MGDLYHDPGSDESLTLMKGWIDDCQRRHELCMKMPHQQVGGPKRLLQCLPDGVRVVETQSRTQRCDYIALSYCWGDGTAVKMTTQETADLHHQRIPDESLPPLYREVVALARGLSISYLWIDALCIIQDSDKDREEEMMQMSKIYSGALVVVVAASAESPLDSLLRVKPQSGQTHTWGTASPIRYKEMDLDVKFRKRPRGAHLFEDATKLTPIAKRAWCFQEKLLASRCLVFCEDEVVWECQSCCLCECGGKQEHFYLEKGPWKGPHRQMLLPLAENEPFQLDGTLRHFADAEAAYSFWENAVENYSRRALTLKTDRLPAISAIASIVAEATGDRYLAGLWRNDLLDGLAWYVSKGFEREEPIPHWKYIAPTWSWVSLQRSVCYFLPRGFKPRHPDDADLEASVLDAWTALEGQNPYGPVSDAAIVLSGFHCDAELTIPELSDNAPLVDFGHDEVQGVNLVEALDCQRVEPDANVDRIGGKPRYLRRSTNPQTYKPIRHPACSGTVHLLWLDKVKSLILTPSRRKEGAYERLGIFGGYNSPKMPKTVQRSSITLV